MRPFSQISQVCEKYQEYQVNPGFSRYLVIDLTTNLTMNFRILSIFIPYCPGFPKNHKNLSSIFLQHVVELRRYIRNDTEKDGICRSNVLIWPFADYVNPRKIRCLVHSQTPYFFARIQGITCAFLFRSNRNHNLPLYMRKGRFLRAKSF